MFKPEILTQLRLQKIYEFYNISGQSRFNMRFCAKVNMMRKIGQAWEMFNAIPAFFEVLLGTIHPLVAIIQRCMLIVLDGERFSNL